MPCNRAYRSDNFANTKYGNDEDTSATPDGRHAVVIMDCASWHADKVAQDREKITIIHLPPYSPELNPVEQVWQWLRQRKLANSCFSGYDNIVDRVSEAWNAFWLVTGISEVKKH